MTEHTFVQSLAELPDDARKLDTPRITTSPSSGAPPRGQTAGIKTFLIADVRGYTTFTQTQGDEAAAELATAFADLARAVIESGGGDLIQLRGDEALAVFDSARQAIKTAIDLQTRFVEQTLADPTPAARGRDRPRRRRGGGGRRRFPRRRAQSRGAALQPRRRRRSSGDPGGRAPRASGRRRHVCRARAGARQGPGRARHGDQGTPEQEDLARGPRLPASARRGRSAPRRARGPQPVQGPPSVRGERRGRFLRP